jgi:hypothetical protein
MRLYFESGTDVACHALFDPAATAGVDPKVFGDAWFDFAKEGLLLPLNTASDGSLRVLVLLDEALPEAWAKRATPAATGLLLRAPGGRLVMSGLEYVADRKEIGGARPFEPARYASSTFASVPAGDYEVDVFVLSWDEGREVAPRLKERLGFRYSVERVAGPLCGLLFFVGLAGSVGAVVYVIAALFRRKPISWLAAVPPLMVLSGFLIGKALERPGFLAARREVEAEFPEVIVLLRRLPDGAGLAGRQGGVVALAEAIDRTAEG